jgi:diketogulonate reductase-like aldo/keto reductase
VTADKVSTIGFGINELRPDRRAAIQAQIQPSHQLGETVIDTAPDYGAAHLAIAKRSSAPARCAEIFATEALCLSRAGSRVSSAR